MKILVGYATKYGSTKDVAEKVAEILKKEKFEVNISLLKDVKTIEEYDAIVLGAALYMHKWHKDLRKFLKQNQEVLQRTPTAIFTLGPVKKPLDKKEWENSQAQLDKSMSQFDWFEPKEVKLFGGKFDPKLLAFPFNKFAASEPSTDIRDWDEIEKWARKVGKTFMS